MNKVAEAFSRAKSIRFLRRLSSERTALLVILSLGILLHSLATSVQIGQSALYFVAAGLLLHYLIYSRDISIPLLYATVYSILLIPLFHVTVIGGIVAYFGGLVYCFHRILRDKPWFHTAPLVVFVMALVVHAIVLTSLLVGDTAEYFAQLEQYTSIHHYATMFFGRLLSDPIWLSGFYEKFPFIYLPFYFSLDVMSPMLIIVINGTFWILTTLMLTRLSIQHLSSRLPEFSPRLFFTLLLLSPTFLLYASQFNKEVSVVFLTVLSVFLYFEDRYIAAGFVAIAVFYLRPYALVAILVYVFYFEGRRYLLGGTAAVALCVLLVDSGTIVSIINGVLMTPYMFVSPLPFDVENWTNARAGLRPLASVITGAAAVGSVLFAIAWPKIRNEYVLIGLGVLAWAFTLSWVGFDRIAASSLNEASYNLFNFGAHVARKKSLIQPLLIAWVVLTIGTLRERIFDIKLNFR